MTAGPSPVIRLVSPERAAELASVPGTLALVRFGGTREAGDGRSPWIGTGLKLLGPKPPLVQSWQVEAPVRCMREGRFTVRSAPGLAMLAATLPAAGDPAAAAEDAYLELFKVAETIGCPHLLRIWQYLPQINAPFADEDRYMRFCAGRRSAFEAAGRPETALPAACLLGDDSDAILLYALAADAPGCQIENPRQVSAFCYPPKYGRASPSFSRALATCGPEETRRLYISGTASVVGHASVHTGILAQLQEVVTNLEALLQVGQAHGGTSVGSLADISPLKVYLRRADDYPSVRDALAQWLPAGHPVVFLRADVCRSELLIEMEGVAASPRTPGSLE